MRASVIAIALLGVGCGETTRVAAPAAIDIATPSPTAIATTTVLTASPSTAAATTPTPTSLPKTQTPSATVIPPPQNRVGPTPTWTATPNPRMMPGFNGCLSSRAYTTTDCVARHLPPGASVTETVNEVGIGTIVIDWLPPVDVNGNVPFPYSRPGPGKTIFTTSAGGVVVTFEVDFL